MADRPVGVRVTTLVPVTGMAIVDRGPRALLTRRRVAARVDGRDTSDAWSMVSVTAHADLAHHADHGIASGALGSRGETGNGATVSPRPARHAARRRPRS
jgi:hypothetical protein